MELRAAILARAFISTAWQCPGRVNAWQKPRVLERGVNPEWGINEEDPLLRKVSALDYFSVSCGVLVIHALLSFSFPASAQDSRELKKEGSANAKLKGEHPLFELMRTKNSKLKDELWGKHPRVYVTDAELEVLRQRAKTTHKEMWHAALERVRALKVDPPTPPAEERRAQNEVGLGIAEAALVYKIEGDKKYLAAAKKYMDAAVGYEIWGYSYNKPNVDLAAGHLLYGMGWGYDLLYNDLTKQERDRYRAKLIRQARLLYDFFKPKSGKTYAYSQNHTFIPVAGLAVTAYALYDETDEAKQWASLSRAIFDRVLATYSTDGYYYEGFEYWIFSTPWLVHYMDAHLHATGEDLYASTEGLRRAHKYVAHSTLPGGEFVFDFGDIYAGSTTRARTGEDYERERIDGHFRTNYNILYNLASRYRSGDAQGVADWLKSKGQVDAEEFWSLIWYDPSLKAVSIEKQSQMIYFADHEVVYWRSNWTNEATAFAFKCGPPEGHHTMEALKQFPDWRLSSGHAHPDAGHFIIWAAGEYMTGDSGYAGIPLTKHHNTLLFAGQGQAREGAGHDVFDGLSYDRLNQIKILRTDLRTDGNDTDVVIKADVTAAYEPEVGVRSFIRSFEFKSPDAFVIKDEVETTKPGVITGFIHADEKIDRISAKKFLVERKGASLVGEIKVSNGAVTKIEPNILTAPGLPGSVDKGEKQERGMMLVFSTSGPVSRASIIVRLKLKLRK